MNNKTVALFLTLGMTMSLAACGSDDGGESPPAGGGEGGESGAIHNSNPVALVQPEFFSGDENKPRS